MRVTITGADDSVRPFDLFALSTEFSFVEWGVLFSTKRIGTPRYPSSKWMYELEKIASPNMQLSLHLCGQAARETIGGSETWLRDRKQFKRVQLNGYESTGMISNGLRMAAKDREFILQARDVMSFAHCARDTELIGGNASVLYDPSGGRGVVVEWPEKPGDWFDAGYAGGIDPDNVGTRIAMASALGASWIDMESGVRDVVVSDGKTDDVFDLERVRCVLERASRFIGHSP